MNGGVKAVICVLFMRCGLLCLEIIEMITALFLALRRTFRTYADLSVPVPFSAWFTTFRVEFDRLLKGGE